MNCIVQHFVHFDYLGLLGLRFLHRTCIRFIIFSIFYASITISLNIIGFSSIGETQICMLRLLSHYDVRTNYIIQLLTARCSTLCLIEQRENSTKTAQALDSIHPRLQNHEYKNISLEVQEQIVPLLITFPIEIW